MGLQYLYKDGEKPCMKQPLKVKLDGCMAGEIRKVKDGFQHFPQGEKKGGEVFEKVSLVQNSLLSIQTPRKDTKALEISTESGLNEDLKKAKSELKKAKILLEKSHSLITASFQLLDKQKDSEEVLNMLDQTVMVGDVETDGHSLLEDMTDLLQDI